MYSYYPVIRVELKVVDLDAAVLTSLGNSDTEATSLDTDTEEQPGLPEPLTALFNTHSGNSHHGKIKVNSEETSHKLKCSIINLKH